ncbi:MAG: 50S ribosomal protein L25/general stress protein Ctc [Epsilonproteobacteria bacterium]|jgi:large subunit ribosomal protein L25|nr:50S ribosomal protein L25/general stress protein Ctc [Campylobacterota bacterium]
MLVGKLRESIGSASARRLRRDGYLTANIYAKGVDNIQVAFRKGDFIKTVRRKESLTFKVKVDGKELDVIIQEYQLHPVTGDILHVDLRVALPDLVTDYLVPVRTVGVPKGLKNKGVLVQSKKRVKVRGKIGNMPKEFVLDVSDLDRDDAILIRDMEAPKDCRLMDKPHVAVCGVIKAK